MSEHHLAARADSDGSETLSFEETVRQRRSVRRFLPQSVPDPLLREVLEEAQMAPSNCNTQPWVVHIARGETLRRISQAILPKWDAQQLSLDFSFAYADFPGIWSERQKKQGSDYYRAMGVSREDAEQRDAIARNNLTFFGAPHAAFLFMPVIGDNVRAGGDVGMYAQTFMLSLASRGIASVPQTVLGMFAEDVKRELGVSNEFKLFFGISFGYADLSSPASTYRIGRVPIEECVTFHD